MDLKRVKKYDLPEGPGVYFFYKGRSVLYIGKATSLKDRVRSYFNGDLGETRGPRLVSMLEQATSLKWQATNSVLEALLLETNLIKKHQPKYNAKEKDDKSFYHIVITNEPWPRVLMLRGKDLATQANVAHNAVFIPEGPYATRSVPVRLLAIFGPFPKASELKVALKLIRKIFPFRDSCQPFDGAQSKGKPCFNRQIGLCPGVCTGEISQKDYKKIIKNLTLFLSGETTKVVKNLEREMKTLAKAQNFEQAAKVRNQLYALQHIQDVALIKESLPFDQAQGNPRQTRIEAYDVAHTAGSGTVGVMTVVVGNEPAPSEYRKFKLKSKNNDVANLREMLERRLGHFEWPAPALIVVDGGVTQFNTAQKVLTEAGVSWPVVAVTKDERHRAREIKGAKEIIALHESAIIKANALAHSFALSYHRKVRRQMLY